MSSKAEDYINALTRLNDAGIIDKMRKAGIIDPAYSIDEEIEKVRNSKVKDWWIVCPDPGDPCRPASDGECYCFGYWESDAEVA
jgi:hypothetical protein